jgi:hypothetical protein
MRYAARSLFSECKYFSPPANQTKYSGGIFSGMFKISPATRRIQDTSQHKVNRAVKSTCKSTRWTDDELAALEMGIELYGDDCELIKSHFKSELKGRTISAVRTKASKLKKGC